MLSSISISSLCVHSSTTLLYNNKNPLRLSPNPFLFRPRNLKNSPFSTASVTSKNLQVSWSNTDETAPDDYNGWAVVETSVQEGEINTKKGLPTFLIIGAGASFAAILGVIAYISISRKGFTFRFTSPLNALHERVFPVETNKENDESQYITSDEPLEKTEPVFDNLSNTNENLTAETSLVTEKGQFGHVIIPYTVDSTQQEALYVLKKLKIIEDDVKAEELCTRREYARWLVQINSHLERNINRRIIPSVALCGSTLAAFDDVSVQDPDFESIQSLAEAGIVSSKLSLEKSNSEGQEVNFFPGRFISRQDLISWKSKLEYETIPGINQEVSRKNLGFLDKRDINPEALVDLFMDILANETSILLRAFGQSKRFQPNKPCTNAQVAVALTSGYTMKLINAELARLEAEANLKQSALEEIKSELLERGDIQKYWETKLEDERILVLETEKAYLTALNELENEKTLQENFKSDLMKQKAALECQKQLVLSLKGEVNEMYKKLEIETVKNKEEQIELENSFRELQVKYEGLVDAKSILEAEIEALRILRSWIEDEARKSEGRAKILEEASQRWRWEDKEK